MAAALQVANVILHFSGRKQKELSDLDKNWHEGGPGRCQQSTIPKRCGTVECYSPGYLAKNTVP